MKGKNNDIDEGRQIIVSTGSHINHSAQLIKIFTYLQCSTQTTTTTQKPHTYQKYDTANYPKDKNLNMGQMQNYTGLASPFNEHHSDEPLMNL